MPTQLQANRWMIVGGYVAFSLSMFLFLLYLTFPYEAVEKRLSAEAANQGFQIKFNGLGPGLFGISASTVQVSKKVDLTESAAGDPIIVRSVAIRPSLSPLGLAFRGRVFGGKVSGAMGWLSDTSVRLDLDELNLADPILKTLSGLDLSGKARGRLSLDLPKAAPNPATKVREPDLSQAKGTLSLNLDQLVVNGGTFTVPIYGEMTPLDLPKISLGDCE